METSGYKSSDLRTSSFVFAMYN